jgi:pyruvate dehydrogenase kinase 2/3/4
LSTLEELDEDEINQWLDRFFALRVSTNMLMSHYLQQTQNPGGSLGGRFHNFDIDGSAEYNPYRSSIDPKCSPAKICKHAADVVARLCRMRYGCAPPIEVVDCESQEFPFVPRYFFYIISELLKNSVRATVETHRGHAACSTEVASEMPPVTVFISGDEGVCAVRVSDEGGGIPVDRLGHVWSYLYTTADPIDQPQSRGGVDSPANLDYLLKNLQFSQESEPESDIEDEDHDDASISRSPLAGLGCGLPLTRLYARYLGGSVELQTLPKFGTDVFVYLNRLGSESLYQDAMGSLTDGSYLSHGH